VLPQVPQWVPREVRGAQQAGLMPAAAAVQALGVLQLLALIPMLQR
jgi:hypothetical protein